jgi:lysophospholipase L1-like esterase
VTEDHLTGHDGPAYPSATDGEAAPEFTPSAAFTVNDDGRRDIGLCFVGDSFTAGVGDPKALGWVGGVVSRTHHPDVEVTAYNLGVRGQDSGEVMARWRAECMPRWVGRGERRLVVGVGANDLRQGLTTARSRLNLANILDDASAKGIATFVVGLTPSLDPDLNTRIGVLAQAQADVCSRRGVTYVDCFGPLVAHEQWAADLAAGDGVHPGQAGYGLIAWLVLHAGWNAWMHLG